MRLSRNGVPVAEQTSDNYGDFKFDKLDENSGAYVVEIEAKGTGNGRSRPSSASASIWGRSGCRLVAIVRLVAMVRDAQRSLRSLP